MLLSSISSSIISSSAITMITSPGLPQYGALMVGALMILLCLKEILSASQTWNKYLNNSFNLVLAPLLLCFFAILVFKVAEIIWFRNSGKIFLFFFPFTFAGQYKSHSIFSIWFFLRFLGYVFHFATSSGFFSLFPETEIKRRIKEVLRSLGKNLKNFEGMLRTMSSRLDDGAGSRKGKHWRNRAGQQQRADF